MGGHGNEVVTRSLWLVLVLTILLWPAQGSAQCTAFWVYPVSGLWSDPVNWENGFPPLPTDVVCITAGPGPYTVTLGESLAVRGLIVDAVSGGPAELWLFDAFGGQVHLTVDDGLEVRCAGSNDGLFPDDLLSIFADCSNPDRV